MKPFPGAADGWCLVLSGGGAKGIYHIGAWKALREMGIGVQAFVGNSIGAIVAGFLACGREKELEEVASRLSLGTLLALPEGPGSALELWKSFVAKGGLDTGPLRRLLDEQIDEDALRARDIDLGVVTINISDFQPREVFLEDMEPGTVVDYLMASSAFPGFAPSTIDGKKHIDGGLWDNLPYEMARSRGWKKIILLDVSGLGLNRRPDLEGAQTVYIKASVTLGGAFDFDRNFLDRFGALGYLDTLRAFGRLAGRYTFLRPDPVLEERFVRHRVRMGGAPWDPKTVPKAFRHDRRHLLVLLDCAAAVLEIDRFRAWTYEELALAIADRAASEDEEVTSALKGTGIVALVRAAVETGNLTGSPYRMARLIRACFRGRTRAMLDRALVALIPELPGAWAYFEATAGFWTASTNSNLSG
jgi:NTE family protein